MTYNGMILNGPKASSNTEVNFAILQKYIEEEKEDEFSVGLEHKLIAEKGEKYFKSLNHLKPNIRRDIDNKNLLTIDSSATYLPIVYCDQDTELMINFGASPFRNHQPQFQEGLLQYFNEDIHQFGERQAEEVEQPAQDGSQSQI